MRNRWIVLLCVVGAVVLVIRGTVSAQERLVSVAPIQVTPAFSFGMIGLGTSQTARLNAVNQVRVPPPVAISLVLIPCKVELDLYDGQGKLLKQKTIANLGFGQADFLDLTRGEISTTATHVDVSGIVKVGSSQAFFCNVSPTLEVFDSVTGATAAILAASPYSSPGLIFTPVPLSPTTGPQ